MRVGSSSTILRIPSLSDREFSAFKGNAQGSIIVHAVYKESFGITNLKDVRRWGHSACAPTPSSIVIPSQSLRIRKAACERFNENARGLDHPPGMKGLPFNNPVHHGSRSNFAEELCVAKDCALAFAV